MANQDEDDIPMLFGSTSRQSCTTWACHWPTLAEPREKLNGGEVKAHINALYESGVPFFAKKAFQDVVDQLDSHPTAGDEIITKDLTGASLKWKVRLGLSKELCVRDDENNWNEQEFTFSQCALTYNPKERLIRDLDHDKIDVPDWAYAPISLIHSVDRPDKESETRKWIPTAPIGEREDVAHDFQEKSEAWEKSETCENFKSILRSVVSNHEIDNIIGFACGSIALEANEQCAVQTALLLTVRNWLKERDQDKRIPCYLQDPMNTDVDREVLADWDVEILDDPRGWLKVDERSVVLSVAPNVPVKEIIADIARPAIAIWFKVPDKDEYSTDPSTSRVRTMMADYDIFEFEPTVDGLHGNVMIYIRKSAIPPIPNADGTFWPLKIEAGQEITEGVPSEQ
ncbi:uncharacterized protein N7483_004172 [Penicillium malachiteum]|uniref:uncharacterized protein n=1 Tax=Penicillium malachiteum TaxID=1324776 RepID=UPI0025485C1D|nr:uncharacterized protein N7483_004172 [Penicillium malachiteum]KAJ5729664.1 hypothetical protein N7483_004172 [Penicillium malachiteum]